MPCWKNPFPESSRVQHTTTQHFWAQDRFFRFLVSLPWSTKAQSRTLTTTLVSGTTRSRFINVLHKKHRKHRQQSIKKCLSWWAQCLPDKFQENTIGSELLFPKFLKCSNAIIWQTSSAPHWTERSADEARHNRDLHLWARSWCVRWYVYFCPTLKLVTLDVSSHLFAHRFLSTSEAVSLMFHSEWKLLTLISGPPLALDVRICFDLLIDVFVALLFCSFCLTSVQFKDEEEQKAAGPRIFWSFSPTRIFSSHILVLKLRLFLIL